jgi:hypothetical protein
MLQKSSIEIDNPDSSQGVISEIDARLCDEWCSLQCGHGNAVSSYPDTRIRTAEAKNKACRYIDRKVLCSEHSHTPASSVRFGSVHLA